MGVQVIVGTAKGALILTSDDQRKAWDIEGPIYRGWFVTAAARDPGGRTYLGLTHEVYGTVVMISDDMKDWRQIENGPKFTVADGLTMNSIWCFHVASDGIYAGVDEAGLFKSTDRGENWLPVTGLNACPGRENWQPGAGGLCLHHILSDNNNPNRLWVGISAVGVMRSEDAGATWKELNKDIRTEDISYCNHGLVHDPENADVIYRREHFGVYKSLNGGDDWQSIETGLPSDFGFPIGMSRATRDLFLIPLESGEYRAPNDGALKVFRTQNEGESWAPLQSGLPQERVSTSVLRQAMSLDDLDPAGIYFGTTSGSIHASCDNGETWSELANMQGRVMCVEAFRI